MDEVFSIAIDAKKIRSLKNVNKIIISHKSTPRWKSVKQKFSEHKTKRIRFYNQLYSDTIVGDIVHISETVLLGEKTIKIILKI